MILAMVANTARDRRKRPQAFTPVEFLPQWHVDEGGAVTEPTADEVRAAVREMNAAFGGEDRVH